MGWPASGQRFEAAEGAQFFDDLAGAGVVAVEFAAERAAVFFFFQIDVPGAEEVVELVERNAVGQGLGEKVVLVHFGEELLASGVGDLEGTGVFEGVGAFGGNPAALAAADVLDLEAGLARGALAEEVEQDLGIDLGLQEGAELLLEALVGGVVDARLGIDDAIHPVRLTMVTCSCSRRGGPWW